MATTHPAPAAEKVPPRQNGDRMSTLDMAAVAQAQQKGFETQEYADFAARLRARSPHS